MEWFHVWWLWLTSRGVARVCQHQLSFLLLGPYIPTIVLIICQSNLQLSVAALSVINDDCDDEKLQSTLPVHRSSFSVTLTTMRLVILSSVVWYQRKGFLSEARSEKVHALVSWKFIDLLTCELVFTYVRIASCHLSEYTFVIYV